MLKNAYLVANIGADTAENERPVFRPKLRGEDRGEPEAGAPLRAPRPGTEGGASSAP